MFSDTAALTAYTASMPTTTTTPTANTKTTTVTDAATIPAAADDDDDDDDDVNDVTVAPGNADNDHATRTTPSTACR